MPRRKCAWVRASRLLSLAPRNDLTSRSRVSPSIRRRGTGCLCSRASARDLGTTGTISKRFPASAVEVLGQFTGGDVSENVLPPLLNIPDNSGLLIVASGRGLRQNVLLRFWGYTHSSPHATIWAVASNGWPAHSASVTKAISRLKPPISILTQLGSLVTASSIRAGRLRTSTTSRRLLTTPKVSHWQSTRLTVNRVVPVNCANSSREMPIST
jgi:hypothetical protein